MDRPAKGEPSRMVTTDTIEGTINGFVSYHYDVFADVLYLRLQSEMHTPSIGDVNDDGDIELYDERAGRLIGVTIVSWWKRFGHCALPDSLREIQRRIEPLANRIAA
jgi:uncharacterized protein YuzE